MGSRVYAALRAQGRGAGRGRIERLMRPHDSRAIIMAPRRSICAIDSRHGLPIGRLVFLACFDLGSVTIALSAGIPEREAKLSESACPGNSG
jgi:hypothetical protein